MVLDNVESTAGHLGSNSELGLIPILAWIENLAPVIGFLTDNGQWQVQDFITKPGLGLIQVQNSTPGASWIN
jgi:hypothetical protein